MGLAPIRQWNYSRCERSNSRFRGVVTPERWGTHPIESGITPVDTGVIASFLGYDAVFCESRAA